MELMCSMPIFASTAVIPAKNAEPKANKIQSIILPLLYVRVKGVPVGHHTLPMGRAPADPGGRLPFHAALHGVRAFLFLCVGKHRTAIHSPPLPAARQLSKPLRPEPCPFALRKPRNFALGGAFAEPKCSIARFFPSRKREGLGRRGGPRKASPVSTV